MKETKREYSLAQKWMARRICEFPTLYRNGQDVIADCILGTQGSPFWNKKGLVEQGDMCFNPKTKKYKPYPLKIPLEQGLELLNTHYSNADILSFNYNIGSGLIKNIPLNANKSWLEEISHFLYKWGKYSLDDFKLMATMKCMLHWGVKENINAGEPRRTIEGYEKFLKLLPSWQASIKEVEYYQQNKHIDPKTFQGMYI